jgi:hypothetical protein
MLVGGVVRRGQSVAIVGILLVRRGLGQRRNMGRLARRGQRFVGVRLIIVFIIMFVMIMFVVIVAAVTVGVVQTFVMVMMIMVMVIVVMMITVVVIIAVPGVGIVVSGVVMRRALVACRVQFRLSLALERLGRLGRIGFRAFDDFALNALAAAAAARIAVARTPAVGTVFVLFLGLAMGALVGLDQGLTVGDRDLIIIGMDFAEGQKTMAVTAILDEGRLQRGFYPRDLGEVDVAAQLLALGRFEIKFFDAISADHHDPGLFRVGGIDQHFVGHLGTLGGGGRV